MNKCKDSDAGRLMLIIDYLYKAKLLAECCDLVGDRDCRVISDMFDSLSMRACCSQVIDDDSYQESGV